MQKVILYTTHCPRCEVLKNKLDTYGIDYEICADKQEMTTLGIVHVPMLSVDGVIYNFRDANEQLTRGGLFNEHSN